MKGFILLIKNVLSRKPDIMSNQEVQNLEFKKSHNVEERHLLNKLFMGKK